MRKRKTILTLTVVLGLLFSCVLLFGGGDKKEEGPVAITVWDWQVMENYMVAFDKILSMYEEAHPNLTIERKAIASGEYEKQFKAALAGDEAPDLFQVQHGVQTNAYNEAGILYDFYPDWKADPEFQKLIDVHDPAWADCWVDGKLVVFPIPDQWIHAIYYYKDMLTKYGIKEPKTVEDWIEIAPVLKKNNIIPLMTAFGPNSIVWIPNCLWNELMMQTFGGDVILQLQSGKMSWENPKVVESLQAIKDMYDGSVFPDDVNSAEYFPDVGTRFQNKQAFSFYIAGDWMIGTMNEEDVNNNNIGVIPPPKVKPGYKSGYAAAAGVLYGMQPDNPHKDIVIDILKFFMSREAAMVLIDNNIHPSSKLAADLPMENNLMKEVIKESTRGDYFYSPYCIASDPEVGRRQVENLGKLFAGIMTVEEACADLEKFTKEQLGK